MCRITRESEERLHLGRRRLVDTELPGELRKPVGGGHGHLSAIVTPSLSCRIVETEGLAGGNGGLADFPHLDSRGHAWMVDVTGKATTARHAEARALVLMNRATVERVAAGDLPSGDVLAAARTAGVLAAKRASALLPLCHPLLLGAITVDFLVGPCWIEVASSVEALDRTGVEMEALTACGVAGLTIYAACKSYDDDLVIDKLTVWSKSGGRSGTWTRGPDGVHHDPQAGAGVASTNPRADAGPGTG